MKNKTLSIIVPAYNEEETIELFFDEVNAQTLDLPLDKTFYFINDGSSDRTLDVIKTLSQKHSNVKYISFSRNFGKEAALLAGLRAASGDFVTVMDADLQDPQICSTRCMISFKKVTILWEHEEFHGKMSPLFVQFLLELFIRL